MAKKKDESTESEDTSTAAPEAPKESRAKAFLNSAVVKAIAKKYKGDELTIAAESKAKQYPRISSGIFPVDYSLCGGWAVGGVHVGFGFQHSGKTTNVMRAIGNGQDLCANCWTGSIQSGDCACKKFRECVAAFINVESTWDEPWSQRFMDTSRLIYNQPSYGEQAIDIAEALLLSGEIDILALDSLAFLVPMVEIEKSMEEESMGLQARLIGKAVRKILMAANTVEKSTGHRPTIFFTNQIRMKIGVMFGCFHEDTPIMFADGSQPCIRDVVEKKLKGPVLSWDGDKVVENEITAWHDNGTLGPDERWLTFRTDGTGGTRGAMGFTCTPNHVLVTAEGKEVPAADVKVGQSLLSWYESSITPLEQEIITGSLFGDGHLYQGDANTTAGLKLSNSEQPEYLKWKLAAFKSMGFSKVNSTGGRVVFASTRSFELGLMKKHFYQTTQEGITQRCIPDDALRAATLRTLAVWYMDDGNYRKEHRNACISIKRFTATEGSRIAATIAERYPGANYSETQQSVMLPTATFQQFSKDIAAFVPSFMSYKLLPEHREMAKADADTSVDQVPVCVRKPTPVRVVSIHESERKHRSTRKYDLTVAGNSFYMVGGDSRGVVVHNSPETQPGGHAYHFLSTSEVRFAAGKVEVDESTKENPNGTGKPLTAEFRFRIDKNKAGGTRGMEGDYKVCMSPYEMKEVGDVIDENSIISLAEKAGILTGGGASWKLFDEKIGPKGEFERRMIQEPDYKKAICAKIMPILLAR